MYNNIGIVKERMIMNKKIPRTFQKKLIFFNFLTIICIASAISFYTFFSYKNDVIANETENSVNRLHSLSARLDIAYTEMINIVQNCASRKTLFLNSTRSTYAHSDEIQLYSANVLKDLCAVSGYNQYINQIIVYEKDSVCLQAGTSYGSLQAPEALMKTPWFDALLTRELQAYELTLQDNIFFSYTRRDPKVLPLLRPWEHVSAETPRDAWVYLAISPMLFEQSLSFMPQDKNITILTADYTTISSINIEKPQLDSVRLILAEHPEISGHIIEHVNGNDCVIAWERQPVSGLVFCEILPIKEMPLDKQVLYTTIFLIFMSAMVIGLALSLLFSRNLIRPIDRLTRHIKVISTGEFTKNPDIETKDEFGLIGKQINEMSSRISELMDSRIQDEKEKMNMEIKILQAQINPHFLYNTLDSIKWIATMQHSTGIVKVVSALSSLLKNMAKGFNEKVTIRQELDFLENYITIEKIRYIELFDVEITVDDPELYNARIVKLTLQPIVENSIFSGIEPSGKPGLIQIHIYAEDQVLYISIRDNGIGISEENIRRLLTDTGRVTKNYMSGIGLPNVDRRIKLVYGEEYGLKMESEIGSYTCVTVSLPLEFSDEMQEI